ncbi:MAG: ABC transporter ATP-binding protein [Desulfobacterium sp.]|nr:ABC transporter ATP-binding protein [Desulfobacterium sp.]
MPENWSKNGQSMGKALDLSQVSFKYKGTDTFALVDVSWSLAPGECAVIMGPSASGKTTLCRCLNGLIPQALEGTLTGDIVVAGKDVSFFRTQTLAKDVGFVMQDPEAQIVGRTVFEDLAFGPRNLLVPAREIAQKIPEVLSLVGLAGYENRSAADLSGGEKQRLAIAGILAMEPSILILDEPASELDPAGRADLYFHLDRLRQLKKLTLVIVEQKIEGIQAMVDRVLVLEKGRVISQGRPEDLKHLWAQPGIRPGIPNRHTDSPPRDTPACLEVNHLDFGYTPETLVLKDINLSVFPWDFTALMGHNGAGKTTLVKHLNGLIPCGAGTILFEGKDINRFKIKALARSVGFIFQNPDHQIFETSVEKEIAFGLANMGCSKDEIARTVDETLEKTGLESFRSRHPFTLGKGMRQMIAVAAIVALNPRVLVVDEPTTGLDAAGSSLIMDLIQGLHANGTAILLITHDLSLAARYASRLVVMGQGEILLDDHMEKGLGKTDVLQRAGLLPDSSDFSPAKAGALHD